MTRSLVRAFGFVLLVCSVLGSCASAQQTEPAAPTPAANVNTTGTAPASTGASTTQQGGTGNTPGSTSTNPPAATTGSSAAANAASTPPRADIRVSTRLVVLDVVVTDRKGNLISGLNRDDFQVQEAGQPQTLLRFDRAVDHLAPQTAQIRSTADLDRVAPDAPVNIILLDEFNTRFEDMAFARYSLKKYLSREPDVLATPTILIAVSLDRFDVLQDYTQDKAAILNALDHHFSANPWRNLSRSWVPQRVSTAFGTLLRVAQATAGHPGHKNMLWIGRGMPSLNYANYPVDAEQQVENIVQRCVNALRDSRVTLYTMDPAGVLVNPYDYGQDAGDIDPFGGNYVFGKLAKATGGRAFYGRNDVDQEIATGIRDGASFYTLTYRPTTASLEATKFRKIVVTIKDHPDAVVTTREGYYVQQPPTRVNPDKPSQMLAFELGAAQNSNMVYDGVRLNFLPDPDPNSFRIHVDSKSLAWSLATDEEPRRAEIVLLAITFDKKGKELKRIARVIKAAAPRDVPPTGRLERALDLAIKLDPDPKAVRARFVVRVSASGKIGTLDATLPKPAALADSNSATQ